MQDLKVNPQVESEFKNSPLHVEMKKSKKFVECVYCLTKQAHADKPESLFWKDAWEFVQKRSKKKS